MLFSSSDATAVWAIVTNVLSVSWLYSTVLCIAADGIT